MCMTYQSDKKYEFVRFVKVNLPVQVQFIHLGGDCLKPWWKEVPLK